MNVIQPGKAASDSILYFTESVIEKCGERTPGSQGSLCAADDMYEAMNGFCGSVSKETFTMHPGSQFGIGRAAGAAYVLAVILLIFGNLFSFAAAALCIVVFAYAVIHYFFYGAVFDCFFKTKTGCNVIGTLEPSGAVRRQVIISGHHDSAYTFNFFSKLERLAGIRLLLGMLFFIYIMSISIVFSIITAAGQEISLTGAPLVLAVIGLLFAAPLFFFISKNASPGAGDNLNGSSVALHAVKYFSEGRSLKHTRLIALSTDGEEAGQRGAIAYAKRHKEELTCMPSFVINIDSVYKKEELAVLVRDRHGIVPLSPELAALCLDTASKLGYSARKITCPFGSGTDAAAFAKAGVKAATIIAMSTSLFDEGHVYHTLSDTVESIEPEAVEAVFNIVINTVLNMDGEE